MFDWLKPSPERVAATALYETTLAAARQPALYAAIGMPDTIEGRFEMLALHLAALIERIGRFEVVAKRLPKLLTEKFVEDMDDAMRARGVGDLKVPQKVKKAAAALYDRHRAYAAAMTSPDSQLAWKTALRKQFGDLAGLENIEFDALARYAAHLSPHLSVQTDDRIAAGQIDFPHAPSS